MDGVRLSSVVAVCVLSLLPSCGSDATGTGSTSEALTGLTVVNAANGLCMADAGYSKSNGTQYVQWSCDGGSDDSFDFTANSDGSYQVQNTGSLLCLNDLGWSTSAGATIGQWSCNRGNKNQNWFLSPVSSGVYELKNVFSGLCASFGTSGSNGTGLVQEACGGSGQAFKINLSGGGGGGGSGVTIQSPMGGSAVSNPVTVTATASESGAVNQMQVWDNGTKLGFYMNSNTSSPTMSLSVSYPSLPSGANALTVEDLDNSFNVIHKTTVNLTVGASGDAGGGGGGDAGGGGSGLPAHVILVLEENTPYGSVTSSSMPNLWNMRSQGSVLTGYYAATHPSIGNYTDLGWGAVSTNDDSCTPTSCGFPYRGSNIVRSLNAAGRSWKGYAEDLPSACYLGGNSGNYYVRHSPIPYISDVQSNCANGYVAFQDASLGFSHDVSAGTLPNYAFVTPNACDDAHNCSLGTADSWLQNKIIGPLANGGHLNATSGDSVLIVTFDESVDSDTANGGGHVYWFAVGKGIKQNYVSSFNFYSHPSTLRLTCELNGIPGGSCPGAAAGAPDLGEVRQ